MLNKEIRSFLLRSPYILFNLRERRRLRVWLNLCANDFEDIFG